MADKYSTIQIWYTDILEGTCRVADQGDPAHHEISHMGDYPSFDYSKADVRKAGKIIARDVPWTNDSEPLIREAFTIANSWRDSHAFPMRSIRLSVLYYLRGTARISAARLKRMQAIRGKLRRLGHLRLDYLQDLGGCRIILPTIKDVQTLTARLKTELRHTKRKENDYISCPKDDGYRSHHLIWSYCGRRGLTMFDGRSVELQVRTNLQHSWATTIEAVGLYRGEALKSRQGSEEWLRLFTLMSAEFAESENCATPDSTPEKATRRTEIRDLARSQDAVVVLDTVSRGFNGTDLPLAHEYKPSHFLIRYDRVKRKVTVEPHNMALSATRSYDLAENASNQTGSEDESIVLVEVDKIDKLREAYPNYFGDVTKFKTCLEELVLGRPAFEYVGPTRQPKPRLDTPAGDSAWLRGAKFPRPSLKPVKR